jgi:hypothetical protein
MTSPSPPPGGEGGTSLEPLQGEQPTPLARYSQRIFSFPQPPTPNPILTTPAFLHSSAIVSVAKQFHPIFLLFSMLLVHR